MLSRGGWASGRMREGQTIRFRLAGPAKLSISRPRDFLNQAKMLFLFAGTPPPPAPKIDANVKIYGPGVYHESISPHSGQTIYLAPGSYFFGGVNLWQVDHVKILGRGTVVYDGPQDPTADEGWMHKQDWHCVVADQAHDIEVHGLTCIVRSRTWSIQMKDTDGILYDDLRVIARCTSDHALQLRAPGRPPRSVSCCASSLRRR